jgi:hypothetical protein
MGKLGVFLIAESATEESAVETASTQTMSASADEREKIRSEFLKYICVNLRQSA